MVTLYLILERAAAATVESLIGSCTAIVMEECAGGRSNGGRGGESVGRDNCDTTPVSSNLLFCHLLIQPGDH